MSAIRNAQAPERFTQKFLEELGFTSTNDRLFIPVLKALGFLDNTGVPQQRYFDYLDETESKVVLAQGIREAYEDLFRVKKDAQKLPKDQLQSKLRSLTQGQLSDGVLDNMARTFLELVKFADFDSASQSLVPAEAVSTKEEVGAVTDLHRCEIHRSSTAPRQSFFALCN